MAGARVVYSNVAEDTDVGGSLFEGRKFWIAQRCPMRSHFLAEVQANGGTVVPLEKQADWLICDHLRKDSPVGGISYEFIQESIKAGRLLDPFAFACGPKLNTVREIGSTVRPARGIRQKFTADDDKFLIEWMSEHIGEGGTSKGNKIFQQLETQNNRHTWQSWRDRWVKRIGGEPRAPAIRASVNHSPPTPPSEENEEAAPPPRPTVRKVEVDSGTGRTKPPVASSSRRASFKAPLAEFTALEFHELFRVARDIQEMTMREARKSFVNWAAGCDGEHTGEEWQALWDLHVQPIDEIIEAEVGRMKLYKKSWLRWNKYHEDATAEEWVTYWEQDLRPKVELIVDGQGESQSWENMDVGEDSDEPSAVDEFEKPKNLRIDGGKASDKSPAKHTPVHPTGKMIQVSPTTQSSGKVKWKPNPYSAQLSQPTKRPMDEDDVEDSPVKQVSPDAKRQRTGLDSAAQAGQKLNEVLEKPSPKGVQADEPIEIIDSNSSSSSQDEQDIADITSSPYLDQDVGAAAEDYNFDVHVEGNQPLGSISNLREPSPTLSFNGYPNLPDEVDFPEIVPFEDDAVEFPNSSPPPREIPRNQQFDTQAILTGESQPLQFSLPDPYISEGEEEMSEDEDSYVPVKMLPANQSPRLEWSPSPSPPVSHETVPLADHINHLVRQGHLEIDVLVALRSTSMVRDLAAIVLKSLEARRGIPADVKGIWTEKDDQDAEGGDARMIRRVRKKHGELGLGGYLGRLEFLRQYRLR